MQNSIAVQQQFIKQMMKQHNDIIEAVENNPNATLDELNQAEDSRIQYKVLNDIASTLAAVRFCKSPLDEKNVSYELMFAFMKHFFHEQRKNLKYSDNVNAVDFASNVMVKLCQVPAFGDSVMTEEFNAFIETLKQEA